jgi:DUF1680 family protein
MGVLVLTVCLAAVWLCGSVPAGAAPGRLEPLPLRSVTVDDAFWSPMLDLWTQVTLTDSLDKFERDGALRNFEKVRDGVRDGEHAGPPWYDGLIYEMIRGCADFLARRPDARLQARLDAIIDRVSAAAAADPDGYLMTWTQLKEPTHRFGMNGGDDNWQHEIYNLGAMVEAGVHYYRATGRTTLLRTAVRLTGYVTRTVGPPPRANVIPGHSIAEEALVELWTLFRDDPGLAARLGAPVEADAVLRLSEWFIEARGHTEGRKSFGAYGQDHKPVFEQASIEGHAVRASLMAAGVAALARANGRAEYAETASRLYRSMVERRMYVTGGLGAIAGHEGFGQDYELPNNGYLETCAAVGSAFFCRRMNLLTGDAGPMDELERAVYNGAICGVSLSGDRYSYVNPLEYGRDHKRWEWHGCPCCPPMLAKLVGAVPGWIYARDTDGLAVNLFIGSRATVELGGVETAVALSTRYPWEGGVTLKVDPARPATWTLRMRAPAWARPSGPADLYRSSFRGAITVRVNGEPVARPRIERGYLTLRRTWSAGDVVTVDFPMPVRRLHARPEVKACQGRVALARGPIIYSVEAVDVQAPPSGLWLPEREAVRASFEPDLLGGVTVLRTRARTRAGAGMRPLVAEVMAVPYYTYGNRGAADMAVWLREEAPAP